MGGMCGSNNKADSGGGGTPSGGASGSGGMGVAGGEDFPKGGASESEVGSAGLQNDGARTYRIRSQRRWPRRQSVSLPGRLHFFGDVFCGQFELRSDVAVKTNLLVQGSVGAHHLKSELLRKRA